MSLRALRHFVVVAEELHMHRAAERLHIAQPALSQQIKQLEQRLGVVLFSRANRRLTLTAAGEAFLHKTRLALEMADQAVLDAQRTARGEQGRLHLGYVSSAMYDSKLPGLLRRLRADWPGIELSLVQGDVQMLYEALLDLRLDIAIIRAPLACVGALNLASLRTDNWISLDDPQGTGLEQVFMDACRVAGFTPQVAQRINDVTSMISLVSAGVGVALVPLSARALRLDNVVYIDLQDRLAESELSMVYHRHIRSAVVRKVISLLNTAER
ncbi:TPA: LysR family transcriptional regulator [Klebsiella pneumoniae subsp. pneumoniae]|nr:LysR family transcriptional regulator [Klebsiella pneumoniae subsp. pneumoniae]HBQ5838408.1 LysR family transcriptional regulator [Klebsiella pneumoniae subsp. pneumoniae]HCC0239210.1 LysR family transcriptional regulator [Klebsiella pneumoniae]HDO7226366.1 LysR family transcriptional regulator [Klebsiella pneumoniae]